MTIERQAGYVFLTFEPDDWTHPAGGARSIIEEIKKLGHVSRNPSGFEYLVEEKWWRIGDTEANRQRLEDWKKKYLPPDPGQQHLFLTERCGNCGREFVPSNTTEEAAEQSRRFFGPASGEDGAVTVCGECAQAILRKMSVEN